MFFHYMKLLFTFLISLTVVCIYGQSNNSNHDFYTIERYNENHSSPQYIVFNSGLVTATNFPEKIKLVKGLENISLKLRNTESDLKGNKHYRYVQISNGYEVFGSMFIAHEQNGSITSCNGKIFETPKNLSVLHSAEEALNAVLARNKNTLYYFQQQDVSAFLQSITGNASSVNLPAPYLMILPAPLNEVYHTSKLVYVVDLYAIEPMSRKVYYIDALTLELLFTEDKIETTNTPGKANTKYSGVQDIMTDSVQQGVYHLRESSRGLGQGIETYNMQKGTVYTTATHFIDADNYWNNYNTNFDEVGGDAHWGTEKTYDFYKNVLKRNSIDGLGFKLTSFVHYSTNYINAFWNGYFMTYGDGGSGYSPLTSLDVCGHEITHGLTQKTAALIYSNESGALNESFSDIFGVAIDFYTMPATANFQIGEQFSPGGSAFRDMKDPKIYQNPSTYRGQYWISSKTDNAGVHYNSGVQNKWYYLLCKGDTGTNDNGAAYKVDSIGYLKAAQISFQNLTTFLTPLSNYDDARFYSILAAKQLFGDCSNEVKQVINAWYAVGVGEADSSLKASFTSSRSISCSIPFTIDFYNHSNDANAFQWDFGDGQTSSLPNPTHTYTSFSTFNVKLRAYSCNNIDRDSITLLGYVKTDSTLGECQRNVMPKSKVGIPLTSCSGILRDDGDTGTYGNLIYSVRSIVPANSSVLKLTFKSFDFEDNFDFLYVYDGIDTLGKLLGKYTGSSLPNGGVILCPSGAATLRQTSDYLLSGSGFEIDWQCISKTTTDYKLETANDKIFGRKNTSSALTQNQNIALQLKSNGSQLGSATLLKYKLNNGAIANKVVNLVAGVANIILGPFDLSPVGSSTLMAWVEDAADGVKENDTLKFSIRQVDNPPMVLPYTENFDGLDEVWLYQKTTTVGGNINLDYDNSSPQCRLRTNASNVFVFGLRSITFDKSDRHWITDTLPQTNFLTLTYNMSNIALLHSPLLFRFAYVQHGDKQYPNDAVWVRGCDTCAWVKFFDLFLNKAAGGATKSTPLYNLNYFLDSAKQTLTSSFQIRIGQQDQNSAINAQQYTGYTFDNIRFSTWNTGISSTQILDDIAIYPNPSHGIFTVGTKKKLARFEITDLKGCTITNETVPSSHYFELNLSSLQKGIYIIHFYDERNLVHHQKLTIL